MLKIFNFLINNRNLSVNLFNNSWGSSCIIFNSLNFSFDVGDFLSKIFKLELEIFFCLLASFKFFFQWSKLFCIGRFFSFNFCSFFKKNVSLSLQLGNNWSKFFNLSIHFVDFCNSSIDGIFNLGPCVGKFENFIITGIISSFSIS